MKTFIEIGVADFDNMLDAKNWRGVVCEPHPYFYSKLKESCTNPHVIVLDVAISDSIGLAEMYVPTEQYIKRTENNEEEYWTRGIGTIVPAGGAHTKLDNAIRAYGLEKSEVAETISIKTTTLDSIVNTFNYDTIDFLKIDAEGHDLVILETYSWRVKPLFIKCEHGEPKNPGVTTQRMLKVLESQGYKCWVEDWDIYAVSL